LIRYLLSLLICLWVSSVFAFGPATVCTSSSHVDTCGQASDTTIIGQADGSTGTSTKSTDDILCSKTPVHYSGCTVDEVVVRMASFDATEYVKAAIYEDNGATSAMLGSESNAIEGDGVDGDKTITFSSAVTPTGTHVWICFHCSSGMGFDYEDGLSSGDYATKTISGNDYDTGMPASLDLSGGTDQYGVDAIGRNP